MEDFSYNSRYSSYKPPTPPTEENGMFPAVTSASYQQTGSAHTPRGFSADWNDVGSNAMPAVISQDALEEKRRRALKEREREVAAKQRQRELLAQKREMELKKKLADEQLMKEKEIARIQAIETENHEKERRRIESIEYAEEKSKKEEEERRRMALVEKKREQALRMIEMQRLREEEAQRIKREAILRKRKEMERIRDEADRMYAERKKEEMDRKIWLVEEMKRKREERLIELEKRRANPLLIQQEKEFSQLIELQASIARVQTKLEQIQTRREDVRERLLEARHVVEKLDVEERQMCIAIEEVEADLKKLQGFQEGLARLVTTRYEDDDYEKSVIKVQNLFRQRKAFRLKNMLKEQKWQEDLQNAAVKIQKIQRGRAIRKMQKDEKMVAKAIKLQAVLRGRRARRLVKNMKKSILEQEQQDLMAAKIQSNFRCFRAKRIFAHLKFEYQEKLKIQAEIRKKGVKRHENEVRRAAEKKKLQQKMVAGELGRIYMSAPAVKSVGMLPNGKTPRSRRFVPTAATAAVAAVAEEIGTFDFAARNVGAEPKQHAAVASVRQVKAS